MDLAAVTHLAGAGVAVLHAAVAANPDLVLLAPIGGVAAHVLAVAALPYRVG